MRPKMNQRDFENKYDPSRWNAQTTMPPMDIDIFRREIKGKDSLSGSPNAL